ADIVKRDFADRPSVGSNEAEVGEEISFAAKAANEPERTAAPQRPFPGFRLDQEGFEKLTLGTCFASGGAWKYGYSWNPNRVAGRFAGNCRREVSYPCTFSL